MTWTRLQFAPGIVKDDSPQQAQGFYIDGDKVRFVDGLPEEIYGWERASTSALLGICRGVMTWQDQQRSAWAAFGTHLRLYAMDLDGGVTDITPATAYGSPTFNVSTTLNETAVTVANWTHGLSVDQKFRIQGASPATVGGVTMDGTYVVLAVISATSLTYTAATAATSTAGPTAVSALTTSYLAPGQVDGLAGAGFGTGGYGSGGFGGASSGVTLYPRTWSFAPWGQNLLANPRGDGIYEWAPNTTADELLTNGSFSSAAGWSSGAGWSVGGGLAVGSSGASSNLDQAIILQPGAYHLLTLNLSISAGTLAAISTSTIGAAISATGNYRRVFYAGGGLTTLRLLKDASFVGTVHDVSVQVLTTAQIVSGAPTRVGSMCVTAERITVAFGSNLDGIFDPLQVDWSDAEDHMNWTPTSSNLAGGFTLPAGGRIVRGLRGARENILWTVEAIWAMRYIGLPNVYDFVEMGSGCGLIGPNAAAQIGGVWYWMTPAGAFYAYGGADPQMIPCTLSRDLKDNLALVQGDKVYAAALVGKNYAEVWFFYPDVRDGAECSRYVIYDTIKGTWSCGTFDRSAYVGAGTFEFPLATDLTGGIWYHEKGFSNDGGPRSFSLTSAFNKAPGADAIVFNGVKPNADDLQGGYQITFKSITRRASGMYSRDYPALSITAATGQKSVRVKGEMVQMTISGEGSPSFWRMGAIEFDVFGIRRSS